jgi:hypothetical protein
MARGSRSGTSQIITERRLKAPRSETKKPTRAAVYLRFQEDQKGPLSRSRNEPFCRDVGEYGRQITRCPKQRCPP